MPLRGEVNSAIPQIQEPVGYVTINGVKYPVEQSNPHRRLDESVWERLGGFEDLPYQLGLGSEVSLAQVQALDDRLSQLEAQSGEVRDNNEFEDLRAEIEALRAQVGSGQSELQAANDAIQALNSRVQEEADLQALRRGGQGALSELDQITDGQVADGAAIDYPKIVYPKQTMDANLDTPIASSFSGGSYTEVLRVAFSNVDENHLINLGGTKLKLRDGGTGAASGVCTIFWKIIANNASGTETNQLVIADGSLAIISDGSGGFVPTDDGTGGGTQLPGGPLLTWKAIREFSTVAQDPFFTLESGIWSYPLSNLYISVWMQADSGETGYIETATAGDCVLNVGGLGELQNS